MFQSHKILVFSSVFLILPLLYLTYFVEEPNEPELYLSKLLLGNAILSLLFWHDPIKNSIIHKLDSFLVRVSVVAVFIYIACIKQIEYTYKSLFFTLYAFFLGLAKISNVFSREEWCSNQHIFYHFLMHIVGISGSYIAFVQ
jgi:hypothetical protein